FSGCWDGIWRGGGQLLAGGWNWSLGSALRVPPRTHPLAGQELEMGTCEITALDRDLSHPRRAITRQTARCACRHGQAAGTARAKPACVDARLIASQQWCGMEPCEEGEQCALLRNRSGWSCMRRLGRIKTITTTQKPVRDPTQLTSC
uniref:TAFA chemokine like family member 5 n=1 Tax=Accipiter nisus TaxID=211598 RepID=A0A8B9RPW1_9AVES